MNPNSKRAIALHRDDSVAVAVEAIEPGDRVTVEVKGTDLPQSIDALERIPFGFKIARNNLAKGAPVLKHGQVMGRATSAIKKGQQVHIHNVAGLRVQREEKNGEKP